MADPFSGGIMPQVIQNRQGLQGLEMNQLAMQQQQQQMQQQQAQQAREAEAEQLLSKFQQGGGTDFSLINQAVLKSPTAAKNVLATIGIADKAQKQSAANDIASLLPAIDDPAMFNRAIAQRIASIKERGGNPADSIRLAQVYQEQGPEAAKRELQIVGAALANEGFLKPEMIGLGAPAGQITPYQQEQLRLREREVAAAETRAARPDTQVTIDNKQDTEIAKLSAKDYQGIIAKAATANKELATIGTLEKLSDKAFSGAGAGAFLAGAKVLKQAGIETEGLKESEVYEKIANTLVLDKSQQMSGALSNGDMVFLQNTVPNLSTSKEGRKLTFDISKKLAQREKEVAKLATDFRRANKGSFDSGEFQVYLDEWKEANPLFEGSGSASDGGVEQPKVVSWDSLPPNGGN
jgi:hypothetical protein